MYYPYDMYDTYYDEEISTKGKKKRKVEKHWRRKKQVGKIKCCFLEPTKKVRKLLIRTAEGPTEAHFGDHRVEVVAEIIPTHDTENGPLQIDEPYLSTKWPQECDCGFKFRFRDEWTTEYHRVYRRADTGEEMILRDAPVGAMWYAPWLDHLYRPQLEHVLIVKLPDKTEWIADSKAKNCRDAKNYDWQHHWTREPADPKHHCWVVHGVPPLITVDKKGNTCEAGGGSIWSDGWHGFLWNGVLK